MGCGEDESGKGRARGGEGKGRGSGVWVQGAVFWAWHSAHPWGISRGISRSVRLRRGRIRSRARRGRADSFARADSFGRCPAGRGGRRRGIGGARGILRGVRVSALRCALFSAPLFSIPLTRVCGCRGWSPALYVLLHKALHRCLGGPRCEHCARCLEAKCRAFAGRCTVVARRPRMCVLAVLRGAANAGYYEGWCARVLREALAIVRGRVPLACRVAASGLYRYPNVRSAHCSWEVYSITCTVYTVYCDVRTFQ